MLLLHSPNPMCFCQSGHFKGGSSLGASDPCEHLSRGSGLEGAACELGTWADDIGLWVCVTTCVPLLRQPVASCLRTVVTGQGRAKLSCE